jgi:hypothetical protein
MTDDTILPFCFPAVHAKKVTAAFDGGRLTSNGSVMLLAPQRRDPSAQAQNGASWLDSALKSDGVVDDSTMFKNRRRSYGLRPAPSLRS